MFKKKQSMVVISCSHHSRWLQVLARAGGVGDYEPNVRRGDRRYQIQGELRVSFEDDDGRHGRVLNILDVSNEGLMAKGNDSIPEATPVQMLVIVDEHPVEIRGEVVHCTGTLGGFKIGIRLDLSGYADSESD